MRITIRFLTVALTLISIVSAIGCSSGTNNTSSNNSGASSDSSMVRMMKMLPSDSGEFYFANVSALFTDGNSALVGNASKGLNYLMTSNHITLGEYAKDFDLSQLTNDVAQNSTTSYDYKGVKVWVQKYGSAILLDNIEIRGDDNYSIQRCIEVIKGEKPSLYDNKDFKDIADRLTGGDTIGIADSSYASDSQVGLLTQGYSLTKQGTTEIMTGLYKFTNATAAQQYVTLVQEGLADSPLGDGANSTVTQDGMFVKMTITSIGPYNPAPSNESKYLTVQDQIQNAVTAYAADHEGAIPTLKGTYSNANCSSCKMVNMSALLVINNGLLRSCPDGLWKGNSSNDDNCDATGGNISGCSNSNHYIWLVDNYGTVYSYCKGSGCKTNNSGYQSVWP